MSPVWEPSLARLRTRRSKKWTTYGPEVLPLPVAEMDVRLADPIAAVLHAAVDNSDTGYVGSQTEYVDAFACFADGRWGWTLDPAAVRTCADVATGVTEVLRLLVTPGERVVLSPPVYPPFWAWLDAVGAEPVEVPLTVEGRLDLVGIAAAAAGGVRALLLCHPQNPTGRVNSVAELAELASIAARYGMIVLADEIHAPLTMPGVDFSPYLTVSEQAADTGIAFHSASKAWNLAGLKAAQIVAAGAGSRAVLERLSPELHWGVGQFGMLAGTAAYSGGVAWLDELRAALASNVDLLASLLASELPQVGFQRPDSTYLAWLDCRELGIGDDPAAEFLARGRVALSSGPGFGAPGLGHARLNLACHPDLLREAVARIAAVAHNGVH
jgi:cysteine-S-conjugate beta-lyase